MSYNTKLLRALRSNGVKASPVLGWSRRGHGPMGDVKGILLHHTAGPRSGELPSRRVLVKGRPDLPGPLCNIALGRSGRSYVVAGGVAWHAGAPDLPRTVQEQLGTTDGNRHLIGIEMENTGVGERWSPEQVAGAVAVCAALCHIYGFGPERITYHKLWAPSRKIDPANFPSITNFRAMVRDRLRFTTKTPAKHKRKESKRKAKPDLKSVLRVSGVYGPLTDALLRRELGVPPFEGDEFKNNVIAERVWLALADRLGAPNDTDSKKRFVAEWAGLGGSDVTKVLRDGPTPELVSAIQRWLVSNLNEGDSK